MENKKLELEAEIGRLFLRIEQIKFEQSQIAQKINENLRKIKELEDGNKKD